MDTLIDSIHLGIRSKYPAMWVVSHEEGRLLSEIAEMTKGFGSSKLGEFRMMTWSVASGLKVFDRKTRKFIVSDGDMTDPMDILSYIQEAEVMGLIVLTDYHEFLSDPVIRRKFRETAMESRATMKSILVLSPVVDIPTTLEKVITVIEAPLPDRTQLEARYTNIAGRRAKSTNMNLDVAMENMDAIVTAGIGLTQVEFDMCIGRSMSKYNALDARSVGLVAHEKAQIVKKSGLMEFLETTTTFDDVGGNDLLKQYITRRKRAFSPAAREFGLDVPKGTLYVGPPGIGKSLIAKATAAALGIPLVRLDMGALFGGLVGESEANARKAIQTAEAVSPCVLWLDEIEKGMAGLGGSGNSDGGTTARVFSTFLTWMNEKTSPVYVFATANDVSALPPELLRKGRFDEIFAADFPVAEERAQIIEIHLNKRKQDPSRIDINAIASATDSFSGAELEALVNDALYTAFDDGERMMTTEDIIVAAAATVPIAKTMSERIEWLRDWAKNRARAASSFHFQKAPRPSGPVGVAGDDLDLFAD